MILFLYGSDVYKSDLSTAISSVTDIDKLRGSSVLITGATGLIGSFITDMLAEYSRESGAGITVYATGRSLKRLEERFRGCPEGTVRLIEYDVNAPADFGFDADFIIHAAGNAYPAAFAGDPVGTVMGNITGTANLLGYAKKRGAKRFVFVSSGEVYGKAPETVTVFKEDYSGYVDPTLPRSCYPSSKRAAETLCAAYRSQYGVDTVIVRPCHTYGPNATGSDNRANVQFVNNALAGKDIVMNSPGLQLRSYCYIADCASAILSVMLKGEGGEAYNIANPDATVTIAGFAEEVAAYTGKKVIFSVPDDAAKAQQTFIPHAVLDSSKLCSLGWTGQYSVKKGVSHTIDVLRGTEK